ncbi:MAG: methionine adenosyltransferase [Sphaerochaeta sp.]|jgi:S-adenosylmethionine synthetase|nr:methionine adenosyltransferase [Sphaerochaeta sp.]MDX9914827.1 methionine adenosyltransferase [Sphaerochaeta sp.]
MKSSVFTSESVSEGHPDKVCDQISDAILDACLAQDQESRVACEVLATTACVIVAGEITTTARLDIEAIVREVVKDVGYDRSEEGFAYQDLAVVNLITTQSPDICLGVSAQTSRWGQQGAGDQGMMFGYACTETPSLMPAPIMWAHQLLRRASALRKSGVVMLRPDAKSQVTVRYEGEQPVHIDAVVISHQHEEEVGHDELEEFLRSQVIAPVLGETGLYDEHTTVYINPTGRFVIGGPVGDTGLTGRKIIVDTYGGMGRHGGGAFSGKDPSKVDRSSAYMARHVAKSLVSAGLCTRCEVQLSYAIGVPFPISVRVDTFGTAREDEKVLERLVTDSFDLSPAGIIDELDLRRPIYRSSMNYGHFGRDGVSWEAAKPL